MPPLAGFLPSLGVQEQEVKPFSAGFLSFALALAGYFMLVPLRDEAGVAIGTDHLPKLFAASLILTFLAAPVATAFLSRSAAKERGLQLLFRALSWSILGFLLLYLAAGSQPATQRAVPAGEATQAAGGGSVLSGATQQADRRHLLAAAGSAQLPHLQTAVRVAFYLWVTLINLVAVSALWARSADVFSPEAASRLFGLLGAGATLGQLLGSLAAGALARAPLLQAAGGPSLLPLLASAAALELAGQAAGRYSGVKPARSTHSMPAGGEAGGVESDVEHTGGRGSSHALRGASKRVVTSSSSGSSSGKSTPDSAVVLSSRGDGKLAGTTTSSSTSRRARTSKQGGGPLDQLLGRSLEGYRLIRASPYLLHMCAFLALNYITSSFFYFSKTLAVAQVRDAASRTAWFATINSLSALFILVLQLLATGRVLRHLGLPLALSLLPASAGLLMAAVALRPAPGTVAVAEVLRKIVAYSVARPAREGLFTVVSREEKYAAKLFLDTVVQRVGDAVAAAAFQALVPALRLGPGGLAAACVPVCGLWAAVAYRLGQRHRRLAAALADRSRPALDVT